ncbi:hypothetical protein JOF56_001419 [Kibdelosporangium banguiense]|uniref:Uncharacterized protein n=1 Tax=Kibdelosporangium banguiense TaxID=1365924 RepID=A0ABS4T9D3_9PSEU|nr:hypothetical protein [Kibdelosporangium banguiense]MBP2321034.1 hypothetical protein [Kibdelosporangium banguiense]
MPEDDAGARERPTVRVVLQRHRNRIIEYLEVAASFDDQQEYERNVQIVHVPYEVINQWEDWFPKDPRHNFDFLDVYDAAEVDAVCQFQVAWEAAADALSDDYPPLSEVQALPEWEQLRSAAEVALTVFMKRGMMPEDHEVA